MEKKQWVNGNWWVSQFNYLPEFREGIKLPKKISIHDATLRDGEQTPGVVYTAAEKLEIAKMLDEIGVERIEAGMPAVSPQDVKAIKDIVGLGLRAKIYSFARAMREDIDLALECGVDGVIIEIPAGRPKLKYQFPNWSDEEVIRRSVDTVKYAKGSGMEVVYFGYDTTRADFDFLQRLYSAVLSQGKPDGVGMVDTMGCILPGAVKELVKKLKAMFDVRIEIHGHNDFGMAVATSFAAVEGGAEVIHTCINGLGERTGNAALEPIILGLKALYGYDVDYNIGKLKEVSEKVAAYSNFPVAVNQPVVGENIFVRESGIGIDLVQNQPLAMFALNPSFLNHQAGMVLGKKSGLKSIEVKFGELGLQGDDAAKRKVLEIVKEKSISLKRTITEEEFIAIAQDVLENQ